MNLSLLTPPGAEPVSLDEAKTHLRIDEDCDCAGDDAYLQALISAARQYCECFQNRAYITQTWEMSLERFTRVVEIPKGSLQAVDSVIYRDAMGAETELIEGTDYIYSSRGIHGRLTTPYDKTWPCFAPYPLDPVVIRFTCGYGDAEAVPAQVKQAVLLLVGHWYENRVPIETAGNGKMALEIEFAVKVLLWQDRIIPV